MLAEHAVFELGGGPWYGYWYGVILQVVEGVFASFRGPLATNVLQSLPYWFDVRQLKRWSTISEGVTVVDRCIGPASQRIPVSYTNVLFPRLLGQTGLSQVLEKDVQLIPMFEGQCVDDL